MGAIPSLLRPESLEKKPVVVMKEARVRAKQQVLYTSIGMRLDFNDIFYYFSQDLNSGKTALHMVVEKASLTDVQFMLETCRANINTTTYTGCTPLHIASGRGDIALTAYLLSMGANPDLVTDEGDTALDLAGSDQVCMVCAL